MIVDIVVIGIIVLAAIIGLIVGFYKSVLGLIASLLSFVIAFFVAGIVTRALISIDGLARFLFGPTVFGNVRNFVPETLTSSGGIISSLLSPFAESITNNPYVLEGAISQHDATVALLIYATVSAVVAAILFTIARLILMFFVRALKRLRPNGRVRPLSRVFGFIIGGAKGLIFAITIFMFMSFLTPFVGAISNQVDNSVIGGPIFNITARHQQLMVAGDVDAVLDRILPFAINTLGGTG